MFALTYDCPVCGTTWREHWPHHCNSDCPDCKAGDIEPSEWADLTAEIWAIEDRTRRAWDRHWNRVSRT